MCCFVKSQHLIDMEKHKFKISAPTWNAKFELPDGLYSVSDIQDYVECIIKKQETVTVNPAIKIYEKRIENKITFKLTQGIILNF